MPAGRPKDGTRKLNKLTEDDLKKIEAMAGLGMNMTQMSAILGISKRTLEREQKRNENLDAAIERGRSQAIMKVSKTAYDMAISGNQPEMTRFYLKCRAGWAEKQDINITGKQEIIFATRIGEDGTLKTVESGKDKLVLEDFDVKPES